MPSEAYYDELPISNVYNALAWHICSSSNRSIVTIHLGSETINQTGPR